MFSIQRFKYELFRLQFYSLKVGAIRDSSAEFYVLEKDPQMWAHVRKNLVQNYTTALRHLGYVFYRNLKLLLTEKYCRIEWLGYRSDPNLSLHSNVSTYCNNIIATR